LCVYLKSKMTVSTDCKGKMNICPRNYKLDWTQPVHVIMGWDIQNLFLLWSMTFPVMY
jgi:hypothetical protein